MGADGKIEALNRAIAEMLDALTNDADAPAEIKIAVIRFSGTEAAVHLPLQPVQAAQWSPMAARGKTPLGAALQRLATLLSDEREIRRNSYYPTLVLLSDGQPTDDWQTPLGALLQSDRGRKTVRLSVAIGSDSDADVLKAFASDPVNGVLRADQARQIHNFFRWLTATIASRTRAPRPNQAPILPPPSLDEIEF